MKWNLLTFLYFCRPFLHSWIRIRNPDPNTDPGTLLNPDPIRIRILIRIHNTADRESIPVLTLALISFSHWAMRLAGQMIRVVLVFIRLSFPFHPASSCKEKGTSKNLVRRNQVCESDIYSRTPIQQFSVYRFANPISILGPQSSNFQFTWRYRRHPDPDPDQHKIKA